MKDSNVIPDDNYKKQGKETQESWTKNRKQKHVKIIAFAAKVSAKGVIDLDFVPLISKVDYVLLIN
jgi:hypothetical protein